MSWWMRGLSATDDDILRRTFVISLSASGNFLWFLLCLERSCGRRVCLPVPTCGHAILCVSGKCRRQRQVSAIWSRRAQRATVCPLGQWPPLPHCCHLSRWRGCALPCASALCCLVVLLPLKRKQHPETPSLSTPDSGPGSRGTINGLLTRIIIALHMMPSQSRRRLLRLRLTWNNQLRLSKAQQIQALTGYIYNFQWEVGWGTW